MREGRFVLALAMMCGMVVPGCDAARRVAGGLTGQTVKIVQVGAGKATITDRKSGVSHVRVECNNGLVIDADWKRNPASEFGYDIYEPTVSQDFNRFAVMMTARGVIAAYLRGEYD